MQLEKLISKEYQKTEGVSAQELNIIQKENKVVFPSDLVALLLFSDGLKFKPGYEISIDKVEKIVEIGPILNLEWIIKERGFDKKNEFIKNHTEDHLKIANTFSQDRILIGIGPDNLNDIFLYAYDDDEIIKICSSLFTFINEHLI